jgi:hypothetical protein
MAPQNYLKISILEPLCLAIVGCQIATYNAPLLKVFTRPRLRRSLSPKFHSPAAVGFQVLESYDIGLSVQTSSQLHVREEHRWKSPVSPFDVLPFLLCLRARKVNLIFDLVRFIGGKKLS